jgi:L-threonylcarbamoyladenylate synthase
VYTDLHGRIDIILDGGPCRVGVESTVVDGLSDPPVILRPGGVGIEEIRACPGWENVQVAYKDGALQGKEIPRAPGMKYKHYSPKAKVVLFEAGQVAGSVTKRVLRDLGLVEKTSNLCPTPQRIGVVRTRLWERGLGLSVNEYTTNGFADAKMADIHNNDYSCLRVIPCADSDSNSRSSCSPPIMMFDVSLGTDTESIARGLFSALRSLDEKNVDIIYVEGISDAEGDLSAAIMNRLRKAAEDDVRAPDSVLK